MRQRRRSAGSAPVVHIRYAGNDGRMAAIGHCMKRGLWAVPVILLGTVLLFGVLAGTARADLAPHITTGLDTDACAMCHRAHTAFGGGWYRDGLSFETTETALLAFGDNPDTADSGLCFACHGVEQLGSGTDIQTPFAATSKHVLAPDDSEYGPTPKQCSDCHDSHGVARRGDDTPYPALLRVRDLADNQFFTGDAYCAACHVDRPADRWDGLAVWQQTAHAALIDPPVSGTNIVCSACHDPHGSDNPPMVTELLVPPSSPGTVTVPANDRWFCYGCHAGSQATYAGMTAYVGGHASSTATVAIPGEWPATNASRKVGECQVCHAPMGRSDGEGGVIAKLGEKVGRALCETCHAVASSIATDTASLAFPSTRASDKELVVTYDPSVLPSQYGRVSVYTQTTAGTSRLVGPREYGVTGRAGDAAAGDVNGDGTNELVVCDPSASRLEIFASDALAGLMPTTHTSLDAAFTYVAVGDVLDDASGLPEIVAVTRSGTSPYASSVYVYRLNGTSLSKVEGPVSVGNDASGVAVGNVVGDGYSDIAITAAGDDHLYILTEDSGTPGTLATNGPYTTRSAPRGPSIGDAWDDVAGLNEITVANSGESTGTVSVFNGSGTLLGSYDTVAPAGVQAWDTIVADVLPGVGGDETVVALRHDSDDSRVNVFAGMSGGGLGNRQSYTTGQYYRSSALAAGDVNRDGRVELVVANAGLWSPSVPREAPSVQVFTATTDGENLETTPETLWGGGVEVASDAPAVVVADLGGIGESRHPVGAVPDTHVSTETAAASRHVECVDCHNSHESTSTPTAVAASAPGVYGPLKGAWGVGVTDVVGGYTLSGPKQGVEYEYEVCLKCHSGWSQLRGSRNVADEFYTGNASFHGVETSATFSQASSDSFETTTPAWTNSSVVYCVDCHSNQDSTEARGPHSSEDAPVLVRPYWGLTSGDSSNLCYRCHKRSVYYTGTDDAGASISRFHDATIGLTEPKLHYLHVNERGLGCESCHATHGVLDREHLIRGGLGWTHDPDGNPGGECDNDCHTGGTHTYER